MNEYPRLIPMQDFGCTKPITQRWRTRLRKKHREKYALQEMSILFKKNKIAILKDLCQEELPIYIQYKKQENNERMYQLTILAVKCKYPQTLVNYICRFNRYT